MPVLFLSAAERERLDRFPRDVPPTDLDYYFRLSKRELERVKELRGAYNWLGFALHLCCLRYLGFFPSNILELPTQIVEFVAHQLGINPACFGSYGRRSSSQRQHQRQAIALLDYRRATPDDFNRLEEWLFERALEHERPMLLLESGCTYLKQNAIVRPKLVRLARLVSTARNRAQQAIYETLHPLLTEERKAFLDSLLEVESELGRTRLNWLQRTPTGHNLTQLLETLDKIAFLQARGIDTWDVSGMRANRINQLAKIGARATNQYLKRCPPLRRYPIAIAFLRQSLFNLTDDFVEMFDQRLWELYRQSQREFERERLEATQSINEKLQALQQIGRILLDPEVEDATVRQTAFACIEPEQLEIALGEAEQLIRPENDAYIDYFRKSYGTIRRFSGPLLETLQFEARNEQGGLLEALALVRSIHAGERSQLPTSAPTDFIPETWRAYVQTGAGLDWRYYELAALWVLRQRLRSGDVYVPHSRRFQELETYFIPQEDWPERREQVATMTGTPIDPHVRLQLREQSLVQLLARVECLLHDSNSPLREEEDELVLTPLDARPASLQLRQLTAMVTKRLPRLDITEVLMEVDSWTGFSDAFEHLHSSYHRDRRFLCDLYACLLAQACNLNLTQMATSAKLSESSLAWCNFWFVRDDTLRQAIATLVDYHYQHPLSQVWGGGMLASADGQRFPVKGKVRQARALPRYFGYGKGITFYSWTSDQLSQFGSKPIPSTSRDATYVLDEIENNETELPILELTTDTAGYTEVMFALFDVLGLSFSPRLKDMAHQRLYRMPGLDMSGFPKLKSHIRRTLDTSLIEAHWDEILRLAGSIKQGWVSASLIVQKLQAYPRKHPLMRALQEYGRLIKTIHILRWYADEENRRRLNRQLNKGEALHSLRSQIFFANQGMVRGQQDEQLLNQVGCLNLVTNAIVIWNTVYIQRVVEQLRKEGIEVSDELLQRIWPTRHAHINLYGTYNFNPELIRKLILRSLSL